MRDHFNKLAELRMLKWEYDRQQELRREREAKQKRESEGKDQKKTPRP